MTSSGKAKRAKVGDINEGISKFAVATDGVLKCQIDQVMIEVAIKTEKGASEKEKEKKKLKTSKQAQGVSGNVTVPGSTLRASLRQLPCIFFYSTQGACTKGTKCDCSQKFTLRVA
jgi:hypothetical protein